jgi:hypothetical protein
LAADPHFDVQRSFDTRSEASEQSADTRPTTAPGSFTESHDQPAPASQDRLPKASEGESNDDAKDTDEYDME